MSGRWHGLAALARDVAAGAGVVAARELVARARSRRFATGITLYLVAVYGVTLKAYGLAGLARAGRFEPELGLGVFAAVAVLQLLLVTFTVPALTAGAVSGERERRTLDLLLVTPLPAGAIVLGKLLASLAFVLLLLALSLPASALVYLFGGVPPGSFAAVWGMSGATTLAYGAVGIWASTAFRRTSVATVASYLLVFFLTFGSVVASLATLVAAQRPEAPRPLYPMPPPAIYMSPLYALVTVLPFVALEERPFPLFQDIPRPGGAAGAVLVKEGIWATYAFPSGRDPSLPPPPRRPLPWAGNLLFQGLLTAAALGWSTAALSGPRPPAAAGRRGGRRPPER